MVHELGNGCKDKWRFVATQQVKLDRSSGHWLFKSTAGTDAAVDGTMELWDSAGCTPISSTDTGYFKVDQLYLDLGQALRCGANRDTRDINVKMDYELFGVNWALMYYDTHLMNSGDLCETPNEFNNYNFFFKTKNFSKDPRRRVCIQNVHRKSRLCSGQLCNGNHRNRYQTYAPVARREDSLIRRGETI